MSTSPVVLRLTEAMTKYYILSETCSQSIRTLPNRSQLYNDALENWKTRSEFHRPPRGDEAARAKFFSAVDQACKIKSRTPENCYLIIFACAAGIQIVIDQELLELSEPDHRYVMNESRRRSFEHLTANMPKPPGVCFLHSTETTGTFRGNQVRYQDPRSGKTRDCTVTDHITSRLKGRYYLITDDEGMDEEVSEEEMWGMLGI
ncbi:hypothetical protein F5887DRAFT_920869 [Amanita rubescens]|nr:hypothetical protein F5887DRAFT_920869 [Amanita rubescens]